MGVGRGIVGFGGLAVSEEVDAQDLVALLGQDVDPARLAPVALERRSETVDQQHGEIGHPGRLALARQWQHGLRLTPVA